MDPLARKVQGGEYLSQKDQPLIQTVQQGELHVRPEDLQRHAGKARPRAHVYDLGPLFHRAGKQQGEAVQKVLFHHLFRVGDGGEVHLLVPGKEHLEIRLELFPLLGGELDSHGLGLGGETGANVSHGQVPPFPFCRKAR